MAKSTDVITKAPGSSIARTLTLDPKDHQQKLTDAAQAAGADYRFETEGTRLVVDGGKVMGVVGKSGSKEIRFRANKAVILATGGFTSCPDLLEKCMKGLSGIKSMACPAHTGLMHYAAFNLGAQFDGIPWIYANEGMHPTASDMNGYANLFVYGAVKVNANGKRYVNEGMFIGNAMTRALLDQPMKDEEYFNYQIMDQKAYDLAAKAGKPLGVFEENKGLFVQADTYEELAEKLGAPDLPAAMARYNEDMNATGVDSAFGRDVLYGQGTGPVRAGHPAVLCVRQRPLACLRPGHHVRRERGLAAARPIWHSHRRRVRRGRNSLAPDARQCVLPRCSDRCWSLLRHAGRTRGRASGRVSQPRPRGGLSGFRRPGLPPCRNRVLRHGGAAFSRAQAGAAGSWSLIAFYSQRFRWGSSAPMNETASSRVMWHDSAMDGAQLPPAVRGSKCVSTGSCTARDLPGRRRLARPKRFSIFPSLPSSSRENEQCL